MNKEDTRVFSEADEKNLDKVAIQCHMPRLGNHLLRYSKKLENENKQLQQKVNQLETNRDEAIEYIEENRDYQDILIGRTKWENGKFFTEDILREENIKELLSILERGKE